MQGVRYKDLGHEYSNREGKVYISVTTLKGLYCNKFEDLQDFWAVYKGIQAKLGPGYAEKSKMSGYYMRKGGNFKNLALQSDIQKYAPLTIIAQENKIDILEIAKNNPFFFDKWKQQADYANARGTRYHDKKELEALESGYDIIDGIKAPVQYKYSFDLSELTDGFHVEVLLYNHHYQVAGRADKLIIETDIIGDRWMIWDDYKTNKKIDTTNGFQKMKYPLNHLDDCNFIHYAIQINTYEWLLKQFGYKTKSRRITWVRLNEREEEIGSIPMVIPDLQKEVQAMLDHHYQTRIAV
jgi:hypothetical protein